MTENVYCSVNNFHIFLQLLDFEHQVSPRKILILFDNLFNFKHTTCKIQENIKLFHACVKLKEFSFVHFWLSNKIKILLGKKKTDQTQES